MITDKVKGQEHMLRGHELILYSKNAFLYYIVIAVYEIVNKESRAHLRSRASTCSA